MDNLNFNYNSMRAIKARFYNKFGKILNILSILIIVGLACIGALLLIAGNPIGWAVIGFTGWPWMVYVWIDRDLKTLKPNKNSRKIEDVLDGDVLGFIPQNPTPQDLANAVMRCDGGRFFFVRFGISAQYFGELVVDTSTDDIFREMFAIDEILSQKFDPNHGISAAALTAAIIRTSEKVKQVFATLHLDDSDAIIGAEWFAHLKFLIANHSKPLKTGGLARDWSFGYVPTLEKFASNISEKYSRGRSMATKIEVHEDLIDRMIDLLSGGGRTNAALIGPVGSGKETIVEAFAERLMDAEAKIPSSLKFNQVFQLDASSLISAASGRGQIESLVNSLLNEVYRAKNIILFLNHAELFFAEETGAIDIGNILQPVLDNGAIRVILALDEQKFLQISQLKSTLTSTLNRLQLYPIDEDGAMRVLQDQIISLEFTKKVTFTYQSLKEAFRLSERYMHDVAQPQKSVQLLESATNFNNNGLVTAQSVVDAIEKTLGVKVGGSSVNNDSAERDKLLNLENLIHQRMIGQTQAVKSVSAAIRRARAGVRNEKRPIGTFLFLGPTGVGKTELAKSLAAVYFGDESKLISIDLNEYVQAQDVQRLIADGATNPNSLTAQVMKNPFSVVLLDEIEKAHPNVLTSLLQVLDEGVMSDINNKKISFRDTILIATSNAGAIRIGQYVAAGYQVEQFSKIVQDELISSRQFAPEFLNRFDDIVMFKPLSIEDLLQVVSLILDGVNKNLATQKVAVMVDEDAQKMLVQAGYDPRLGARPMRRVVQRTVENIVSEKLLSGELVSGQSLRITSAMIHESGGLDNASTYNNQQAVAPNPMNNPELVNYSSQENIATPGSQLASDPAMRDNQSFN